MEVLRVPIRVRLLGRTYQFNALVDARGDLVRSVAGDICVVIPPSVARRALGISSLSELGG